MRCESPGERATALSPTVTGMRHASFMTFSSVDAPSRQWWHLWQQNNFEPLDPTEWIDGDDADELDESGPIPWYSDDSYAKHATGLGRADFLARVWSIINETRGHQSSTVFGLVGAWGSGKSSMLKWITAEARDDDETPPWTVVNFNPWDYPDSAALQTGFFATLRSRFTGPRWGQAGIWMRNLGVAVAPLGAIPAAFGLFDYSKLIEGGAKLLGPDVGAELARKRLVTTLVETKRPVLVVIDDLDRISSDELLITLKLIRQLGRLPYVHYLLSYDEATILDVLTQTNLISDRGGLSRARDYMEKVVQVRFDVPHLRPDDASDLTSDELEKFAVEAGTELTEEDAVEFARAYTSFMADRLRTPRALRRYFAQVRLLSPEHMNDVSLVDHLIVTWVRTVEPGVYSLLQRKRARLVGEEGTSSTGDASTLQARQERERARWEREFQESGTRPDDVAGAFRAVGRLFPRFANDIGLDVDVRPVMPPRVMFDEYFDRYFSAGIPDDDIPDSVVRRAVEDLENGNAASVAIAQCKISLVQTRNRVVPKLVRAAEELQVRSPAMFAWLAEVHSSDSPHRDITRASHQIETLLINRLRELPSREVTAVIDAVADTPGGVLLANAMFRASNTSYDEPEALKITDAHRSALNASIRKLLVSRNASPLGMPMDVYWAMLAWERTDEAAFERWIRDEADVRGAIDALCFFVHPVTQSGTPAVRYLKGFNSVEAAKYFDLTAIRAKHRKDVLRAEAVDVDHASANLDTPQRRRLIVLNVLREHERASAAGDAGV